MPKPPKDMSEKEYVYSYCPNWIKKNESGSNDKGYLINKCQALWNKYKASSEIVENLIKGGYMPISFSFNAFKYSELGEGNIVMSELKYETVNDSNYTVVDSVAAIGDRFYGRVFVGSDVLRRTVKKWNNTYNDVSHLATAFPAGFGAIENIEYITGYNSSAYFDESINAVRMKMHMRKSAPKYAAWINFYKISRDAGRIPNVSIFGFAKYKAVKPDKLPKNIKMSSDKLTNGYVIVMEDLIPFAVTTCLKGKCDDSAGCGICSMNEVDWNSIKNSCKDDKCDIEQNDDNPYNESESKEKNEANLKLQKYLKERLKELK